VDSFYFRCLNSTRPIAQSLNVSYRNSEWNVSLRDKCLCLPPLGQLRPRGRSRKGGLRRQTCGGVDSRRGRRTRPVFAGHFVLDVAVFFVVSRRKRLLQSRYVKCYALERGRRSSPHRFGAVEVHEASVWRQKGSSHWGRNGLAFFGFLAWEKTVRKWRKMVGDLTRRRKNKINERPCITLTVSLTPDPGPWLNWFCRYGKNSSGLRCRNSESFGVNGIGGWCISKDMRRPRREGWELLHMCVPMCT